MVILRNIAAALLMAAGLSACGTESAHAPATASHSSDSPQVAMAREQAQAFLDALVGSETCAELWDLMVSDGDDRASFCSELDEYRAEVRALTLGQVTDDTEDYTIFAVRVDYADGSPPVLDSEIEVDIVDGKPLVAAGLP